MSEPTRKCGHPVFSFGSNFGPKDCPICPYIRADREKLTGLVEEIDGLTGHLVYNEWDTSHSYIMHDSDKVKEIITKLIRTTPIGDEK